MPKITPEKPKLKSNCIQLDDLNRIERKRLHSAADLSTLKGFLTGLCGNAANCSQEEFQAVQSCN